MIYRSNGCRPLSNIILVATSIFLAHSIGIIAQDMTGKSPSAARPHDASSSVRSEEEKSLPTTGNPVVTLFRMHRCPPTRPKSNSRPRAPLDNT
jgi:hypothetical protein